MKAVGERRMTYYRIYILGSPPPFFGLTRSVELADDLCASTDEEGIVAAWDLYRQHQHSVRGFELWEGTRLVFRHSALDGDRQA